MKGICSFFPPGDVDNMVRKMEPNQLSDKTNTEITKLIVKSEKYKILVLPLLFIFFKRGKK